MHHPIILRRFILATALAWSTVFSFAQIEVKGTVYDRTQRNALEGVSVLSVSGKGTSTDSLGNYSIKLAATDSIYFSYLGKPTAKFAVKSIERTWEFNMSLQVSTDMLPTVVVQSRSYHMDSLENRKEYAKAFGFTKPNPLKTVNMSNGTVGLDPKTIINMFAFKENHHMKAFKERLEDDEHEKYINHRFNKTIIKKLTGLESPDLDTFMVRFRPSYMFTQSSNDVELFEYIQKSGKAFIASKSQESN
jgi:hypothetical protein